MKKRFETRKKGELIKVWDTKKNKSITKALPSMDIANEIAEDFNNMDNKNYSSLRHILK